MGSDTSAKLEHICQRLKQEYSEAGAVAAQFLEEWMSGKIAYANPEIIEQHLDEKYLPLVFDCFRQIVPFGTGGRRGPVGFGPNRMNPATLAMTVQGHCNFLRATYPDRTDLAVVVANDVREFSDFGDIYKFLQGTNPLIGMSSRSLGQLACEIYAGNGITAYFRAADKHHGLMPTPELGFMLRKLRTVGGVQMSASHNPPDDNGLKIYNEYGSQPIAPDDEILVDHMMKVKSVRTMSFEKAVTAGLVKWVPEELHTEYLNLYAEIFGAAHTPDAAIPIVYTALNGCGQVTVGDLLRHLGFKVLTPPNDEPNGAFAAVPLKTPNPEVAQATAPAKAFADQLGSGIVLSSDPDVDRVGLEVKLADGTWYHFDGNQIAAVLCYFLMLDPKGPQRRGLVIETFVTTKLMAEIARKTGSPVVDDLLVGMKYIANVLNELETNGRFRDIEGNPQDLVIAAEESHGVAVSDLIREKDAAPACMYLAILYQILRKEGRTLLDYYLGILQELGAFETINRSIVMAGMDGVHKRDAIMASLRQSPPTLIAGHKVNAVVDFWDEQRFGPFKGFTDKFSRDSIQIFTDHFIVAVRPSGTEPKLKFYCHILPNANAPPIKDIASLQALKRAANEQAKLIYNELLARIDIQLGPVGLDLPDIVDLNRKLHFEQKTTSALRDNISTRQWASLDQMLQWLKQETAAMTPGADPLPALRDAIARQCSQWANENNEQPSLLVELAAWAKG